MTGLAVPGLTVEERFRRPFDLPRRWGVALLAAAFLALVGVILSPDEQRLSVALALADVGVGVGLAVLAWGRGTLRFVLLTAVLPGLLVSWPLTTLYLTWFFPDATYVTALGDRPVLVDADRLQLTVLVFLLAYLVAAWRVLIRLASRREEEPLLGDRVGPEEWGLTLLALVSVTAGWLAPMLDLPDSVRFVAYAMRNFFGSYLFATGLRWQWYTRGRKALVVTTLIVSAYVNTVANSRGLALMPFILLLGGILAMPGLSARARGFIVAAGLLVFPLYTVVGNQTRLTLGSIGIERFSDRAEVLAGTLSGPLQKEQGGILNDTAMRLFGTGGHALIQAHWDDPPFQRLDPGVYLEELAGALLPAFLFGRPESARYTGTSILRDYGFIINERTSVEVSLLGSSFYAGGLPGVALAGFVLALINGAVLALLSRGRAGVLKLVLVAGMVLTNLLAFNLDPIQIVRSVFWVVIYQGGAYYLIRAAVGLFRARAGAVG